MRSDIHFLALVIVCLTAKPVWCQLTQTSADRLSRLENMSASEKDELRRKQERFEKLASMEQDKLRQLEQTLERDPHGDQLRQLMLRYHSWLRALPSSQRTEIVSASAGERIEKIKAVLSQQEDQRRKELAWQVLSREDFEILRNWAKDLFTRAEPALLADLPADQRAKYEKIEDRARRTLVVMGEAIRKRGLQNDADKFEKILAVTEADRRILVDQLSPTAQAAYQKAGSEFDKRTLVQRWVQSTVWRDIMRVSSEERRQFFDRADPKMRDHLDYLPRDQARAEMEKFRFGPPRGRFQGDFKGRPGGGPPSQRPPTEGQ